MSQFCTSCGTPVLPDHRFCGACGAALAEAREVETTETRETAATGATTATPVRGGLAAIALAGATAVVVGTLLPWARTFRGGHPFAESGLDRRAVIAALLALVAGVTAGLHAAGRAETLGGGMRPPRRVDRAVLLGMGAAGAIALAIAAVGVHSDIEAARAANGEASFGPGLLVAAIGIGLLVLAGLLELVTEAPLHPSGLHRFAPVAVVVLAALVATGVVVTGRDDEPSEAARAAAARQMERLTALATEPMTADVKATTDWQQRFNRVLDDIAADREVQRAFLRLLASGGTTAHAIGSGGRLQLIAATEDAGSLTAALHASGEHSWFWKAVGRVVDRATKAVDDAVTRVVQQIVGHTGVASALEKDPESPAATAAVDAARRGDPLPAAGLVDPKIFPPDPERATTSCGANEDRDSLGRCVPRWTGVWAGRWQGTTTGRTSAGDSKTCNAGGTLTVTIDDDDGARMNIKITFGGGGSLVNFDTCEVKAGPDKSFSSAVGHTDRKVDYDDGVVRFSMTKQSVNFADGTASGGQGDVRTTVRVTLARAASP